VIHHIPDASAVLREIRRVMKPGGKCLVALYHTYSLFVLRRLEPLFGWYVVCEGLKPGGGVET
jgi:ubiquinone/menaquinone biosynthesis C-methylase UbiE